MNTINNKFPDPVGFNRRNVSQRERLITGLGGYFGILGVYFVSDSLLDTHGAGMIVAYMGASVVLLLQYHIRHWPSRGMLLAAV